MTPEFHYQLHHPIRRHDFHQDRKRHDPCPGYVYPDGERERVESELIRVHQYSTSDPPQTVPGGVATQNEFLVFRNTFYWDKQVHPPSAPATTQRRTLSLASHDRYSRSNGHPQEH